MDQYYKASQCRRILTDEYPTDGDFSYDPELTWFEDLAYRGQSSRQVKLSFLLGTISDETVGSLYQNNQNFLNGVEVDGASTGGAIACLDSIYEQGITNVHYRQIPACVNARRFSVPVSTLLDHYCLPELARVETSELAHQ